MPSSYFPAVVALFAFSLVGMAVQAQTARGGGGASAQALQQLQQLAAERTQLQADNARLKKELEDLRKELDASRAGRERSLRAAQNEAARSAAAQADATRDLEVQRARMQELLQKSREIVETLRTVESDRNSLRQQFTTTDAALKACVDRNRELYKLNGEILEALERRGGRGEPFTQLARVRLENLIDGYRYRAEEQQVPVP